MGGVSQEWDGGINGYSFSEKRKKCTIKKNKKCAPLEKKIESN
jgi:hypothetical protein